MSNILLGITGGIAAYKSVYLARLLVGAGHNVKTIMTANGEKFVGATTFEAITGNPVFTPAYSPSSISHIEWAKWADICIIAPATANIIGKIRCGLADDPLSTVVLALSCPLLIAPAMNTQMFCSVAVKENIETLYRRGVYIINSPIGSLACGDSGAGRMAEPENIFAATESLLLCRDRKMLEVKKVLVTAGPTKEYIDPVRYITNRSSGKMGYALAEAAWAAGADVTLVTGDVKITSFLQDVLKTVSASEMEKTVMEQGRAADIVIMAAAVADYKPNNFSEQKIKKSDDTINLELIKTVDILKELGENKKNNSILVGFAAETENLDKNATQKMKKKNLDIIVANDVSRQDTGFDSEDNSAKIFFKNGKIIEIEKMTKRKMAAEVIYSLKDILGNTE